MLNEQIHHLNSSLEKSEIKINLFQKDLEMAYINIAQLTTLKKSLESSLTQASDRVSDLTSDKDKFVSEVKQYISNLSFEFDKVLSAHMEQYNQSISELIGQKIRLEFKLGHAGQIAMEMNSEKANLESKFCQSAKKIEELIKEKNGIELKLQIAIENCEKSAAITKSLELKIVKYETSDQNLKNRLSQSITILQKQKVIMRLLFKIF
jgi:chromosome segregation ATPase